MDITLSEIRSFNALVKFGSFTQAAKHLGVSQPAITAQVRRLEARTNQVLLERHHKEIKPTQLGLKLYHLSCEYINLDSAVDEIFNEQPGEQFQLCIATASPIIFMPLIAAFSERYPDAQLQVITGATDFCRSALINNEADIGLFPMYGTQHNFESMAFHHHYLMAIVHPNHPLANAQTIDIKQLSEESIIAHNSDSYTQRYADQMFAQQGLTPTSTMTMDMSEHICNAVALGLGVGFGLSDDIREDNKRYRLVAIDDEDGVIEHVSWLPLHSKKRGIAEFIALAKTHSTLAISSTNH
ncbi:LysR family transcriptional regulator [Gammaproteobacteria bacterium AS21]